eukprot:s3561_g14.t1
MENIREENSELVETNSKLRSRITDVISKKLGDGPSSPHAMVIAELQGVLARLQVELGVKDESLFAISCAMEARTTEEVAEIMVQRDAAILKNGKLYVELQESNKRLTEANQQRQNVEDVVMAVAPQPHAIPHPSGMAMPFNLPKATAPTLSVADRVQEAQNASHPDNEATRRLGEELAEAQARSDRHYEEMREYQS